MLVLRGLISIGWWNFKILPIFVCVGVLLVHNNINITSCLCRHRGLCALLHDGAGPVAGAVPRAVRVRAAARRAVRRVARAQPAAGRAPPRAARRGRRPARAAALPGQARVPAVQGQRCGQWALQTHIISLCPLSTKRSTRHTHTCMRTDETLRPAAATGWHEAASDGSWWASLAVSPFRSWRAVALLEEIWSLLELMPVASSELSKGITVTPIHEEQKKEHSVLISRSLTLYRASQSGGCHFMISHPKKKVHRISRVLLLCSSFFFWFVKKYRCSFCFYSFVAQYYIWFVYYVAPESGTCF